MLNINAEYKHWRIISDWTPAFCCSASCCLAKWCKFPVYLLIMSCALLYHPRYICTSCALKCLLCFVLFFWSMLVFPFVIILPTETPVPTCYLFFVVFHWLSMCPWSHHYYRRYRYCCSKFVSARVTLCLSLHESSILTYSQDSDSCMWKSIPGWIDFSAINPDLK